MKPIGHLARVVAETTLARGELTGMRIQLIANAAVAIVILLVATALSVYKPAGLTPFGRRKEMSAVRMGAEFTTNTHWGRNVLIVTLILLAVFVILHLVGGGAHGH